MLTIASCRAESEISKLLMIYPALGGIIQGAGEESIHQYNRGIVFPLLYSVLIGAFGDVITFFLLIFVSKCYVIEEG